MLLNTATIFLSLSLVPPIASENVLQYQTKKLLNFTSTMSLYTALLPKVLPRFFWMSGNVRIVVQNDYRNYYGYPSIWQRTLIPVLNEEYNVTFQTALLRETSRNSDDDVTPRKKQGLLPGLDANGYLFVVENSTSLPAFLAATRQQWVVRNPIATFVTFSDTNSTDEELTAIFESIWPKHTIVSAFVVDTDLRYVGVFCMFWRRVIRFDFSQDDEIVKSFFDCRNYMNGFPMRVSIFENIPFVVRSPDSAMKYKGIGVNALQFLSDRMNFTIKLIPPSDDEMFGRILRNGTEKVTGSFGQILRGEIDLSMNLALVSDVHVDGSVFTIPLFRDNLCFVVQKSWQIPEWLNMYASIDYKVYVIYFALAVMIFAAWLLILKYSRGFRIEQHVGPIALITMNLFCGFGVVYRKLPSTAERILIASALFGVLVVLNTFQGNLIKAFTQRAYYPNFKTLESFLTSNMPICPHFREYVHVFNNSDEPLYKELAKKVIVPAKYGDIDDYERTVKNCAILTSATRGQYEVLQSIKRNRGVSKLYIPNIVLNSFNLAYVAPENSPFLNRVGESLLVSIRAGLTEKWRNDAVEHTKLEIRKLESSVSPARVFHLEHLLVPIMIYVTGITLSCISFFVEILTLMPRVENGNT